MNKKENRGGARPNSGRPATGRTVTLSVKISKESAELLAPIPNKSEFIDSLIIKTIKGQE